MSTKQQRTRVAAYGLVLNNKRVLLCRVSQELPKWQGQWTLPGGGVEFGEHPEQAMIREVFEETGLTVEPEGVATIDSLYDGSGTLEFHGIRIIYNARYQGGELKHESSGTTDYCKWCTLEEVESLMLVDIARLGVTLLYGKQW